MSASNLVRAALGNVAALGDLYDARTDNFLKISIFNKKIPEDAINLTDNHFSDIRLIHSDTYSEKFSKFDVKGELQGSVLAGLLNLEGSGRYLSDKKTSARAVKISLLYNIKTKEESVNIYDQSLKNSFAVEAAESELATHVVVGISWGANSILSCEYLNTDNRDVTEIEGSLSAQLKKICMSLKSNASVELKKGDNNNDLHFEIHIYGDVLPSNNDLPTSFEEALNFMKQVPTLVEKSNLGRGKPLTYKLLPLSLIQKYLKLSLKADSFIKSLEEDSLLRVIYLFEKITLTKQEIHDFYQDTMNHRFCIQNTDIEMITAIKEEFEIQETKFRSTFGLTLIALRSGNGSTLEFEKLLTDYKSGDFSPEKVSTKLENLNHISEKILFADSLISKGAKYFGKKGNFENVIFDNKIARLYILYFNEDCKTSQIEKWHKNIKLFYQEMTKGIKEDMFWAVDCDIHPNLWPKIGVSIQVFQNGQVVIENMLEASANTAYARCTLAMNPIFSQPNNRVYLVIPCTGKKCKSEIEHEWVCPTCEKQIEYGFDNQLYCLCGYGDASCYEFKCTDKEHGNDYDFHVDKYYVKRHFLQRRLQKEINILIIGETRVGKSIWINAFQNYLKFLSLQEAEKKDLCSLIASKLSICDENYDGITIYTGKDDNEVFITGQSATQKSKVYSFIIDDTKIRLIDTPGLGDARGIDQDRINFENILSTLSYLNELHGICVFLKANNSRSNITFEFCINELLTYLHKEASNNIVFCFTHSRPFFYQPGETLQVLKTLVERNENGKIDISNKTTYCFDSEAYQYLAAVKSKKLFKFSKKVYENNFKSWEHSAKEVIRMLKYISNLKPHIMQSTVYLGKTREYFQNLTRPMAEISKNIETNQEILKNLTKEIQQIIDTIESLNKKKTFSKFELEIIEFDFPKVVCTNYECKKNSEQGNSRSINNTINNTTVCHDCVQLKSATYSSDLVGDETLLHCDCFKMSKCVQCGHSYIEHMFINYDAIEVRKDVENEAVVNVLKIKLSEAEMKREMYCFKKNENIELEKELNSVKESGVKCANFLKHNSITPYNDKMEIYLMHLINDERDKIQNGGCKTTLKSLEIQLESCKQQIKIYNEQLNVCDAIVDDETFEIFSILNTTNFPQKQMDFYQEVPVIIETSSMSFL